MFASYNNRSRQYLSWVKTPAELPLHLHSVLYIAPLNRDNVDKINVERIENYPRLNPSAKIFAFDQLLGFRKDVIRKLQETHRVFTDGSIWDPNIPSCWGFAHNAEPLLLATGELSEDLGEIFGFLDQHPETMATPSLTSATTVTEDPQGPINARTKEVEHDYAEHSEGYESSTTCDELDFDFDFIRLVGSWLEEEPDVKLHDSLLYVGDCASMPSNLIRSSARKPGEQSSAYSDNGSGSPTRERPYSVDDAHEKEERSAKRIRDGGGSMDGTFDRSYAGHGHGLISDQSHKTVSLQES